MKRALYSLLAVTALAAALWGLLVVPRVMPDAVRADTATTSRTDPREFPAPRHEPAAKAEPIPPALEASPDIRARFRASNDYHEFAESILGAARQGDGAAQYYLGVALSTCDFLYRYYFMEQTPGAQPRIRTLDEAQQLTATTQGSAYTPEEVRQIQGCCERLMAVSPSPFGQAREWMEAATSSGYPLALAHAATNKAIGGRHDPSPEKARAAHSEARSLAVEALRTKDPEVVWQLASAAAFLAPEEPGEPLKRQSIWLMAASLRDPGGESMTEWRKLHCSAEAHCHPDDTVRELIRRGAGNDLDEVERRARELNEKIDAVTLDESDI